MLVGKGLSKVSISLLASDIKTVEQDAVTCHGCKLLCRFAYRKSSIKPPGGLFFSLEVGGGALKERGVYLI